VLASAIPKRAVGNQRVVEKIRTVGFTWIRIPS
jgi:hypothetical protein